MARYLERLVARAGVAAEAPASPAPRLPYERQRDDPFENIAAWNPVGAAPLLPVPPALPRSEPSIEPSLPIERSETRFELPVASRPEDPRPHTEPPVERTIPSAVLPPAISFEPVEAPPRQDVHQRPDRPALISAETVIERQTIREKPPAPVAATRSPELSLADIEADVLAKLMPALDAWYASDTPTAPAAPAVPPIISPQRPATEPAAVVQTPQLVIGSISVEVVAAPAAAPTPAPRPRTIPGPAREPDPFPSRLGFGLGQM